MNNRVTLIAVAGLLAMMVFPHVGAASNEGSLDAGMSRPGSVGKLEAGSPKSETASQAPALPSASGTSSHTVRDVPTISGRYSIGGTTVMPYLGAGFGGGYTSDVDRSVNSVLPAPADSGVRSLMGQSLTPNEFRVGIRIPF